MPPPFWVGYYPGKRPYKKKNARGGGRPPPPQEQSSFFYELENNLDFEYGMMSAPGAVRKKVQGDLDNLWVIRSGGLALSKEERARGAFDPLNSTTSDTVFTDPTQAEAQFEEMPGAVGTSFDFKKAFEEGFDVALTDTLNSLSSNVFNFRDFGSAAEVAVWDKAMNPFVGGALGDFSIGAEVIKADADALGAVIDLDKFQEYHKLRDKFRDTVLFGNSFPARMFRMGQLQGGAAKAVKELLENSPYRVGNTDAAYDRIMQKINDYLAAAAEATAAGNDRYGRSGILPADLPFSPHSGTDKKIREAKDRRNKAGQDFWDDLVHDSEVGDFVSRHGAAGANLVRMARAMDFRNNVFQANEIIDAIAEGDIRKFMIGQIARGETLLFLFNKVGSYRTKYFFPAYYIKNFIAWVWGDAGFEDKKVEINGVEKSVKIFNDSLSNTGKQERLSKLFSKLIRPINEFVKRTTNRFVRTGLGSFLFNSATGKLMQSLFLKGGFGQAVAGALGISGVGLPAVIFAAVVQYASEKVVGLVAAAVKWDFDKAYELTIKEFNNIFKFFMGIVLGLVFILWGIGALVSSLVGGPMSALGVGPSGSAGSSGGGVPVPVGTCPVERGYVTTPSYTHYNNVARGSGEHGNDVYWGCSGRENCPASRYCVYRMPGNWIWSQGAYGTSSSGEEEGICYGYTRNGAPPNTKYGWAADVNARSTSENWNVYAPEWGNVEKWKVLVVGNTDSGGYVKLGGWGDGVAGEEKSYYEILLLHLEYLDIKVRKDDEIDPKGVNEIGPMWEGWDQRKYCGVIPPDPPVPHCNAHVHIEAAIDYDPIMPDSAFCR